MMFLSILTGFYVFQYIWIKNIQNNLSASSVIKFQTMSH